MKSSSIKQKPLHQLTAVQLLEQLNQAISHHFFGTRSFGLLGNICQEIQRRRWDTGPYIDQHRINLRYRYKLMANRLTIAEDRQVEDFAILLPAELTFLAPFQNN